MSVDLREQPNIPRLDLDAEAAKSLAATLRSHGFGAERLSQLLDLGSSAPSDARTAALAYQCDSSGPLGTLARLFTLGLPASFEAAAEALAPHDPAALAAAGVLVIHDDEVTATIQIQTFGPYLIAGDRLEWHGHPDFVLQLTESARLLASAAWFPSAGSVLDLGCGAGLLALIASDLGADVVATDINPRAAMFTTFNAHLNDVRIDARVGDLFDTVRGETFDLIVANLPFIIAPDGSRPALTSSHVLDEFSRSFALSAPDHLAADGSCQFLAGWPKVRGARPDDRVLSWFQEFRGDVWVMAFQEFGITDYSAMYVNVLPDSMTSYGEWIRHFAELDVEGVVHGLITMSHSERSHFKVVTHDLTTYDAPFRDHLLKVFEARRKASAESHEGLLEAVLEFGEGVYFVAEHEAGSDGFEAIRVEKRVGIHGGFEIDPIVYALLNACDGSRSLRDAATMAAEVSGQPPSRQMLDGILSIASESLYSGVLRYSH